MKANELMIGDWYAFRGLPYKCTASVIASIAECEKKGVPTDISEIPLTPEILEKNGFVGHRGDYYFSIDHQLAGDGIVTDYITYYQNKRLSIHYADGEISIPCNFVHELQHALRLCGIDKEINL